MRKLNNKGFTLIELLAVIVILALIMVIAIPNVLKAMNSSRASALHSKAKSVVSQFANAYAADSLLASNDPNRELSNNAVKFVTGAVGKWSCIVKNSDFANFASLNDSDYVLASSASTLSNTATLPTNITKTSCSAINYNNGKLKVVLVAKETGKFFVPGYGVTYAYTENDNGTFK